MHVENRIYTNQGDIPASPQLLALPFKLTPSKTHPFLTLGSYFKAIQGFLLRNNGAALDVPLQQSRHTSFCSDAIDTLVIRSEKHGVLYHIASVEIAGAFEPVKLAVSTALSEEGKACLDREYEILQSLSQSHPLPYLPRIYTRGQTEFQGKGQQAHMVMVLSEWFQGFHEWHTSVQKPREGQKIKLWDPDKNHRYLTGVEAYELFREAAKILTLYYDPDTFRQIYPWHHAAGDFIVRIGLDTLEMRLVTIRKYSSVMEAFTTDPIHPLTAVVYFFLNLTIRMRLDRMDGVGKLVWVEDFAVKATAQGFFDALDIMHRNEKFTLCAVDELVALLQSFGLDEIETLLQSLCRLYEECDQEEYAVIQTHLKAHARSLYAVLRQYRG
jgi:hypothetical protein